MLYAAIDIHKRVFQAAVFDEASGELIQERFEADRRSLEGWARRWQGEVEAVAIEATTGWRWVARGLQARGLVVHLVDPGRASALQGRRRAPKTDRLDARWLALLLARQLLSECEAWLPPTAVQELRDRTRLRRALSDDRRRWAQRLHALLTQEGFPCARGRLLTESGQRWLHGLALPPAARAYVERCLALIAALDAQLQELDAELRRFAATDQRCRALQTIYGVGPTIACLLLAEIGQATRFRRPRSLVRAAGLDPVVADSGDRRRRGRLSKAGSPHLRWALVQAAQHAHRQASPDRPGYLRRSQRIGANRAKLVVARAIAQRAYHLLRQLEPAA